MYVLMNRTKIGINSMTENSRTRWMEETTIVSASKAAARMVISVNPPGEVPSKAVIRSIPATLCRMYIG